MSSAFADTWTKHVGFPVVTVSENDKEKSIHVKQNRFLRTADVKPEEDKTIYPVFLGLRTKNGIDEEVTLNKREGDFKVPNTDFYKLNADHSGIYRVNYSPERLQKLGHNAKAGPAISRRPCWNGSRCWRAVSCWLWQDFRTAVAAEELRHRVRLRCVG